MCMVKDSVIHKIFELIDRRKSDSYVPEIQPKFNDKKIIINEVIELIEQRSIKSTIYVDKQI